MPNPPKRLPGRSWFAIWQAPDRVEQEHYIGHDAYLIFDKDTATVRWYIDRGTRPVKRERKKDRLKVKELLRKTGWMLIQKDGPNLESGGFRKYACRVSELEFEGEDADGPFWIKCRVELIRDLW